jgi:hypothetical protein
VAIVEEAGVPQLVTTSCTFMEVKMIGAVKLVDAVGDVLAGVRVDNVKENGQAELVSPVDERFELFGRSIAGRCGEEVCNLVSEG